MKQFVFVKHWLDPNPLYDVEWPEHGGKFSKKKIQKFQRVTNFLLVVTHPIPTEEAVREIDEFAIDIWKILKTFNLPIRGICLPSNRFHYLVSNVILQVYFLVNRFNFIFVKIIFFF